MTPIFSQDQEEQEPPRCLFILPTPFDEFWSFDVPADLAPCIGSYARIPEFAVAGRILTVAGLIHKRPAC